MAPDNDFTRFAEEARRTREFLEGMDCPDPDIEGHVEDACNDLTDAIAKANERAKS